MAKTIASLVGEVGKDANTSNGEFTWQTRGRTFLSNCWLEVRFVGPTKAEASEWEMLRPPGRSSFTDEATGLVFIVLVKEVFVKFTAAESQRMFKTKDLAKATIAVERVFFRLTRRR